MSESEPIEAPDRRGFLGLATALLVGIPILGPLLSSVLCAVCGSSRDEPGEVPALPLNSIPENSVQRFSLSYVRRVGALTERIERIVFLRREGDEVFAFSAECTHLGCSVRFVAAAGSEPAKLACPCHGGAFDMDGRVIAGPPSAPLRRFAVRVPSDQSMPVMIVLG